MKSGFIGSLNELKDRFYQCYIVYIPSNSLVTTEAFRSVTNDFWSFAHSIGPNNLLAGMVQGPGAREARRHFHIESNEDLFIIVDVNPLLWTHGEDPFILLPLAELSNEEITKTCIKLCELSDEDNIIELLEQEENREAREKAFKKMIETLKLVPSIDKVISFFT